METLDLPSPEASAELRQSAPGSLTRNKPDRLHARLRKAIQRRTRRYLWVPQDAISFVPYLSDTIYGDGRALFAIGTLNQRPRFWVFRGDSTWSVGGDYPGADSRTVDIGEFVEGIIWDIEEQFGQARCGYCGSSLSMYSRRDLPPCDQENCSAIDDVEYAKWPAVDDVGGCHWGRMDLPKGFRTVNHPFANATILAARRPNAQRS